jgi:hypothetical protein
LKLETKDGTLSLYPDQAWLHSNGVTSNDLTLMMIHNHYERKTHYVFECSTDCYDERATSKMSQWFQNFLTHLFTKNTTTNEFDQTLQSIANLSRQMQTINKSLAEILQLQPNLSETRKSFNENLFRPCVTSVNRFINCNSSRYSCFKP